MEEIWKNVVGFEDKYIVSNKGNVKRLGHFYENERWGIRFLKEMNLKQTVSRHGYLMTSVMKSKSIHRLVAIAFIPNPENKPEVNHINGIKTDNRVENLEWVTPSENQKHSFKIGIKSTTGSKHALAKTSEAEVVEMRLKFKQGDSIVSLAKKYGLKYMATYMIISGRTWKHC